MIKFGAFLIVTFYASSPFYFITDQASLFEPFFIYIFNSFDVDSCIFFLEVAFGNPDRAYIVNPDIVADWLLCWICGFGEVIIIRFIVDPWSLLGILFLMFEVWAFFSKLMKAWICIFEQSIADVNWCSFQGSSFYITQWTGNIDASRSKSSTYFANPAISRNFCQTDASLMKTNVAHGTKNNEIVLCIVSISTDLALCIFHLYFSFFLFNCFFTMSGFLLIHFFLSLFHVLKEFLFFRVNLVN